MFLTGLTVVFGWVFLILLCNKFLYSLKIQYLVVRFKVNTLYEKFRYPTLNKEFFKILELQDDYVLMEKGQVPNMAFYLVKGKAEIFYDDVKITDLEPKSIIGPDEVLRNHSSSFTVKAKRGSLLGAIGKSDLFTLIKF
jgi:CRP-like cAMP-binding protein